MKMINTPWERSIDHFNIFSMLLSWWVLLVSFRLYHLAHLAHLLIWYFSFFLWIVFPSKSWPYSMIWYNSSDLRKSDILLFRWCRLLFTPNIFFTSLLQLFCCVADFLSREGKVLSLCLKTSSNSSTAFIVHLHLTSVHFIAFALHYWSGEEKVMIFEA